jgi:C1A family cysteine protease
MQGSCGSCWAFATTAVVEAALKIKKGLSVDLSEQELVDCAGGYDNNGCDGGWPAYALEFVEKYGLNTEQEYPYTEVASFFFFFLIWILDLEMK